MRQVCTWLALLTTAAMAAALLACATTGEDSRTPYYRRSSIHRDSFPVNYNPGRVGRVGRPYWY